MRPNPNTGAGGVSVAGRAGRAGEAGAGGAGRAGETCGEEEQEE